MLFFCIAENPPCLDSFSILTPSYAELLSSNLSSNSDADLWALGSLLRWEEQIRYWIFLPWWLHCLLEELNCKAAAEKARCCQALPMTWALARGVMDAHRMKGFSELSFRILGCQYLVTIRTPLHHVPAWQYWGACHTVSGIQLAVLWNSSGRCVGSSVAEFIPLSLMILSAGCGVVACRGCTWMAPAGCQRSWSWEPWWELLAEVSQGAQGWAQLCQQPVGL